MKKFNLTLILAAVLVISLAVFGFGQAGDDFFDSDWYLEIGEHVGGMDLTFDKTFGNNQWSVNLQGNSGLPQEGEEALQGVWGSDLDETFTYTDVMSGAKSSLSESWTIGPWEHGTNNYMLEMGTSASGDKFSQLRYNAGIMWEYTETGNPDNSYTEYAGIATEGYPGCGVGGCEEDEKLLIAAGGPNSKISYSMKAYEDFGDMGYLHVADSAAYGTSDKYAEFTLGDEKPNFDRDILVGATFDAPYGPDGDGPQIWEAEPHQQSWSNNNFNALGDGMLTVTGSGDEWLAAWIKNEAGDGIGSNMIDVTPVGNFDATYTYSKFLVRAAYEGGVDETNPNDWTNWNFKGGGG